MIQEPKFKETEIGMIPEDWGVKIFENELKVKGRIGWKGYTRKDLVEEGPLVIGGAEINSFRFLDLKDAKHLTREKFEESPEIILKQNDILLVTRGNLGEVGFFDEEIGEATINPSIVILSEFKENPLFLFYYLISPQGNYNVMRLRSGSSVPAIYQSAIKKIEYPSPKINEQKAIAKILSDLDSKIELLQQQNKILEKIGQVLFKQWFVDFEFPNEEGKPYRSSGGKMIESELGEIPEGWEVKELQDFIELQKGLSYKGKSLVEEGGLPMANLGTFLPIKGFKSDGLKHYDGEHKDRHLVSPGDMLIANTDITQKRDILGSPAIIPKEIGSDKVLFTHHTFAVRFRDDTLPKPYLYYLLQTPEYRQRAIGFATGTTVLALPKEAILELSFVLPKNGLLGKFKEITRSIFEKRGVNEQSILHLSKTRDSLLPKLMTGKIRVPLEVRE